MGDPRQEMNDFRIGNPNDAERVYSFGAYNLGGSEPNMFDQEIEGMLNVQLTSGGDSNFAELRSCFLRIAISETERKTPAASSVTTEFVDTFLGGLIPPRPKRASRSGLWNG